MGKRANPIKCNEMSDYHKPPYAPQILSVPIAAVVSRSLRGVIYSMLIVFLILVPNFSIKFSTHLILKINFFFTFLTQFFFFEDYFKDCKSCEF